MTTTAPLAPATAGRPASAPAVDVMVPVYNEQRALAPSIRRLHEHVAALPFPTRITIVDNASTDATWPLAQALAADLPGVRAVRLEQKGRGRALKAAWTASDARVLAYMDVDLSTDLAGLLPLVAPLLSGHSDLAIGSRLARGARVVDRTAKREILSRGYNMLLHGALRVRFSDAQCGFKAIRADVARELLPLVEDTGWFFDTELLVLAERAGYRIHEVPVDWTDDPDTRVDVPSTVMGDLRGVARLARGLVSGRLAERLPAARRAAPPGLLRQLWRFALIGVASTLAYALLFLLLRVVTGPQAANFAALLLTAIANTAANRRLTFGVRGRRRVLRHQVEGLVVFGMQLGLTAGALWLLEAVAPGAGRGLELAVLIIASAVATLLRFVLLRAWVFHPSRRADAIEEAAP